MSGEPPTDDGGGWSVGFDLDMTLVDSAAGIEATLRATLAEHGRPLAPAALWPLLGVPLEAIVEALVPDLDGEAVVRRYRELYPVLGVEQVTAMPGAVEAVEAVRALGGRVVVVSAKAERAVLRVLRHVGLAPDEVVGDLFGAGKAVALRRFAARVYVGDHPGDMAAAHAAGCVAVGVGTGPHDLVALRAAGADEVLGNLTELPARLPGWVGPAGPLSGRPGWVRPSGR